MINGKILRVSEYFDEFNNHIEYKILLSITILDECSSEQLRSVDNILNKLYGIGSDYEKRTNESIIQLNSYEYLLPYDISVLLEVFELFTYGENTNAYLGDTLITKEQVSLINRKKFYFFVSEFLKNSIIDLREQEKKSAEATKELKKLLESIFGL